MANNCFYTMKVASKSKEAIERLYKIMSYKDNEYFMYRVFCVDMSPIEEEDGFFTSEFCGDVAWSCCKWFGTMENTEELSDTGAHYITLDILCKKLNIGIELYSEEQGCEFQEHYSVNHYGEIIDNDCVKWNAFLLDYEYDDDEEKPNEDEMEYGFGDDYCAFFDASEIYGEEEEEEEEQES